MLSKVLLGVTTLAIFFQTSVTQAVEEPRFRYNDYPRLQARQFDEVSDGAMMYDVDLNLQAREDFMPEMREKDVLDYLEERDQYDEIDEHFSTIQKRAPASALPIPDPLALAWVKFLVQNGIFSQVRSRYRDVPWSDQWPHHMYSIAWELDEGYYQAMVAMRIPGRIENFLSEIRVAIACLARQGGPLGQIVNGKRGSK